MKFLFLFISILLILWILKTLGRSRNQRAGKETRISNILPCSYCGLHIPEDEAIHHQGKPYCCKEHAEKDTR